jgi:hypothetical protein
VRETQVRPDPSGGPVGGWMTVVGAGDARRCDFQQIEGDFRRFPVEFQ